MADSIKCLCALSEDDRWHCRWAIVDRAGQVDKHIAFSVTPAQFVQTIGSMQRLLANPGTSTPRLELESGSLRFRYRRNAERYELRFQTEKAGLKAMVSEAQLIELLEYHQVCLQEYAIDIYEGRKPIPSGYPEGYPDPHW